MTASTNKSPELGFSEPVNFHLPTAGEHQNTHTPQNPQNFCQKDFIFYLQMYVKKKFDPW